ncbi:hypothetical protein SDC9_132192 [bioreactor metagenome]|uniref:Uncharacterized protein n=1 Tax=bioreactor metagenome TaxID=1076179 RepID=A0A645D7D1_9ZZZZ
MREPRGALRAVVIGTGRAHFQREVFFPVHALWHVGNAEAVLDPHTRVRIDELPRQLVGTNVQAAPALRIGDETGHGHRALEHGGQFFALAHIFPVAWRGAAHFLVAVQLVGLAQFLVGVAARLAGTHFGVLGALLAGMVALGAEAPAVGLGHLVALLVEEVDVVDLLHGTACKARLVLHQILQMRLGGDGVVTVHRLVPRPVRSRPHRMHARQPAHIARDDAAGGEQKARQRHDAAVLRLGSVVRVAPQRIVVANAMRVVANVVARGLMAPRLGRLADLYTDALAQVIQALVGDLGKAALFCDLGEHVCLLC